MILKGIIQPFKIFYLCTIAVLSRDSDLPQKTVSASALPPDTCKNAPMLSGHKKTRLDFHLSGFDTTRCPFLGEP
jgi:hypothetical protein